MQLSRLLFEEVMNHCDRGGMPFRDQAAVVEALAATPSQARKLRLDRRDAAIRNVASRFFGGLSRNKQSVLIRDDLRRISTHSWHGATIETQTKFGALTSLAELGGKALTASQIRHVLAGNRTRAGR